MDDPQRPEIVRIKLRTSVRFARFLNRADQRIPGVVDDNAEPAEVRLRPSNSLLHLICVGHVERHREYSITEVF